MKGEANRDLGLSGPRTEALGSEIVETGCAGGCLRSLPPQVSKSPTAARARVPPPQVLAPNLRDHGSSGPSGHRTVGPPAGAKRTEPASRGPPRGEELRAEGGSVEFPPYHQSERPIPRVGFRGRKHLFGVAASNLVGSPTLGLRIGGRVDGKSLQTPRRDTMKSGLQAAGVGYFPWLTLTCHC